MATFDQLPADQRAIIELLLKRRRSYDALSDMLDMPASRVRELARDALTELAPFTADRVDPDWQAQVADYVLGQQSGPESAATQGHLKRSEPEVAPVVDRLAEEHLVIHGLLDHVDRALVALVADDAAAGLAGLDGAIEQLADALLSHLAYEERELRGPLARHGFY